MQVILAKALAAGFVASMAMGGHTTPQTLNATASPAAIYSQGSTVIILPAKSVENKTALDSWLDKLAFLESKGKNDAKVLDNNGLHSFGCLQFQMSTFEEFGSKYGFISEKDDAGKLIYNCDLQKEIAKLMLLENFGNWRKWYTSVIIKGLGLPPVEERPILLSLR